MIIPEDMTFGQLLLDEIGLEIHFDKIIDQDTRKVVDIPFMPYQTVLTIKHIDSLIKNPKAVNALFNYFLQKIMIEQNIYIDVVYYKQLKNSRNLPLAIKANGKEFISRIYNNESLRYLDLICQLNGGTDVDLSRFDNISFDT